MKNFALRILGSISLALGVLGVFLPLLPTTCFILLSAWAFSQSSPKIYHWLYYQSRFASSIQSWKKHRIVPRKVKAIATLSIVSSFTITAVFIGNVFVLIPLGAGMSVLLGYLLTRNDESSIDNAANLRRNHELRPQVS